MGQGTTPCHLVATSGLQFLAVGDKGKGIVRREGDRV
jgi:hypothetical protein